MITDPTGWLDICMRDGMALATGEEVMAQSGSLWLPRGVVGCCVTATADATQRKDILGELLIAVKNGTSFYGVTITDPGDTLVICPSGEASAWSTRLGAHDVHRLSDDSTWLLDSLNNGGWPSVWKCLHKALKDHISADGWRLIVLDPLDHFVSGDPSTDSIWTNAMRGIHSLTSLGDGATVIVGHDPLGDIPGTGQAPGCEWTSTIESGFFKVRDGDWTDSLTDLTL